MITSFHMIQTMGLAVTLAAGVAACSSISADDACRTATCQSDRQISAAVEARFAKRAEFLPNSIHVQTHDGVVYLYGFVDTRYEKAIATSIARVKGVKDVRNELAEYAM